ncbi:hypothetical protein EDB81DRAFT_49272 [Dactylonectria macrodidyma]|uniref:Uncharacterized protein n=1 Tax=Dactylonectria macrodidyma TaxID=307937 RepID=A0A9P9FT98_9HYPO|nr:hypothetical protein EDB81DRAFT_49272 [Dactylonectria macrodidyma]
MSNNHFSEQSPNMSSRTNSTTLPQGFSVYQPALGAQLQFLPAIGTPQLDELLNAYIPGPASAQEKRASVSLDFLEYSHLTGQSFKFYAVYPMATPVESPATVSPVMSTWDWSQASTSSRSPTSQKARTSPKAGSSRHQADFSHIPGMKIMTKDGLDVTNSASRGSKTKEQRDHAHLMRIIKACDSCKRKKIRCDPSHKKRGVSQISHSQSQSAARVAKKARTAAQEALIPAPAIVPQTDFSVSDSAFTMDQSFAAVDLEMAAPALPALEPWEEFIQYPTADLPADYDFFYDPEGYLSPESSSSLSAFSTKPVTPTCQQDLSSSFSLSTGEVAVPSPELPFNHTDSIHDYVDFNLFSPQSSFSEDDHMVPIEISRQGASQSQSLQSNPFRSDQSPGNRGVDSGEDVLIGNSLSVSWSVSSNLSGEEKPLESPYRDPGLGAEDYYSRSPSSLNSDAVGNPMSWMDEAASVQTHILGTCHNDGDNMVLPHTGLASNGASIAQRVCLGFSKNMKQPLTFWKVSTMEGIRQPTGLDDATSMTRAGLDILTHRVSSDGLTPPQSSPYTGRTALSNAACATQPVARVGSASSVGTTTILATMDVPVVANAAAAAIPSAIPSSLGTDQSTSEYGSAESSDSLHAPSSRSSITASRTVVSDLVNTATVSSDTNSSSIRRGAIADATIIANHRKLLASRGTVAHAMVTPSSDASGQPLSEQSAVALSQIAPAANIRILTDSSRGHQGPEALPQASSDHHLPLTAQHAPRVETYVPTHSLLSTTVDGDVSLMSLMSAMVVLTIGPSAQSAPGRHLATMISAMLLLLAITGWFYQFTPSLRSPFGQPLNSEIGKTKFRRTFTGFVASFQDRLAALPSRASNGQLSVSRVVARSVSLIAV